MEDYVEEKDIQQKKYHTIQNILYVVKSIIKLKKSLILLNVLGIIGEAFVPYIPLFSTKVILDYIQNDTSSLYLYKILIIMGIIEIFLLSLSTITNNLLWPGRAYIRMNHILKRMDKQIKMDYELMENPQMLDSIERATNATSWVSTGIEGLLSHLTMAIINFIKVFVSSIIIFTVSPLLLIIILIIAIIRFVITDITSQKDKKHIQDELSSEFRKVKYIDNICLNFEFAKDIRLFNIKKFIYNKQLNIHNFMYKEICKAKKRWMKCWINNNILSMVQEGFMYFYLLYKFIFNKLTIGNFTLYVGSIRNFGISIDIFFREVVELRKCSREVNDFRTFIEYNIENKTTDILFNKKNLLIEFKNVYYKYPGSDKYIINNLNLKIENGVKLAVVGLNGAGKSTFIKLLCGLYKPSKGVILCNGIDINYLNKEQYFELFAPLFQNIECFACTLAENIALKSNNKIDYVLMNECLRSVGLEEKVKLLPFGLETNILKILYDDGIDLSGGEKQKLALARALYKNAPVILLDEPTAALDPIAEFNIYKDINLLFKDKTCIYISHRLSSTKFCDSIILFKDGSIIEKGTHNDLINLNNEYTKMFNVQSKYYKKEMGDCE